MSQYRLGELYVRRLRIGDKGQDWKTTIQVHAALSLIDAKVRRKSYVVLRRGFPGVIAIGKTKRMAAACLMFSAGGTFKQNAGRWKLSPEERAARAVKALP